MTGPDTPNDDAVIELIFEIDLTDDDVHRPAWGALLATSPDRETLVDEIADDCEFSFDPKSAIYQRYRMLESRREELTPQMEDDGNDE